MQLHIDLRNLIPRKHISFRIKIKAVSKDQVNESPTISGFTIYSKLVIQKLRLVSLKSYR